MAPTLNVRSIDPGAADRIRHAARARGWTIAQYLAALVQLHEAVRARADAGDDALRTELTSLGLNTVTG